MNRSKSRNNRLKISLVHGQSCHNDVDLNENKNLLHISAQVKRDSSAKISSSSSRKDDEIGPLSDVVDVPSPIGIEKLRIQNGFKINLCQPVLKGKRSESKPINFEEPDRPRKACIHSINDRLAELGTSAKLYKSTKNSSPMPNRSLELRHSITSKVECADLPPFKESIIDGFSIIAFSTSSDMELYARLTDTIEETPNRLSGSRSVSAPLNCITGRQRRRIPRHPSGQGKKGALHPRLQHASTVANAAANGTDVSIDETNCVTKDDDGKGEGDAGRLRSLHTDIAPSISTTSCNRTGGNGVSSRPNKSDLNDLSICDSKACFAPSTDKAFLVSSPNNNIMASTKRAGSSTASKRDLFSIAALTAVEVREEASSTMKAPLENHMPQAHSLPQPQPQNPHLNGHALTPAQWLERLSNRTTKTTWNNEGTGITKVAEEELRQLTHLLSTDCAFTEQVARLPSIAQIMAFYQQQQHNQIRQLEHQRCISYSSSSSTSTAQSFVNALNSQQDGIGVDAKQIAATLSSASWSKSAFPSAQSPSLLFTPPVATSLSFGVISPTTSCSNVAHFQTPVNSVFATSTASIHPPMMTPSTAFFSSTAAVAAAIASVLRPSGPGFQVQAPSTAAGQRLPAPISKASMSIPPAPHLPARNPFVPNSPHLTILWNHHHPPSPASDFPHLMTHPSPAPSSKNPAHPRKTVPVDAIDLTSTAVQGSGGGSSKRSPCSRLPISQTQLDSPNFWTRQCSPTAPPIQQPQPLAPSNRRLRQVASFHELFRTEGVPWNSGATAHLRICYHILRNKAHGLKSVNPSNPWWYIEPNPLLLQPKPREHQPPPSPIPRFNYERFLRSTLGSSDSANGGVPLHPIAIDLTRSPSPHVAALAMSSVPKPLQHQAMPRIIDSAKLAQFFQKQQRQQETDLMMSLKRRRMMMEGGPLAFSLPIQSPSQLIPPPHYQNGGMQMPLGSPFPQSHFRHPL